MKPSGKYMPQIVEPEVGVADFNIQLPYRSPEALADRIESFACCRVHEDMTASAIPDCPL